MLLLSVIICKTILWVPNWELHSCGSVVGFLAGEKKQAVLKVPILKCCLNQLHDPNYHRSLLIMSYQTGFGELPQCFFFFLAVVSVFFYIWVIWRNLFTFHIKLFLPQLGFHSPSSACLFLYPADSSLLISDFEPQQASAEAGEEDEFDPIPVTGRKNSQGESFSFILHKEAQVVLSGMSFKIKDR